MKKVNLNEHHGPGTVMFNSHSNRLFSVVTCVLKGSMPKYK